MHKVSVIIPNYNHSRYLEKRIESVLNQTYKDFELILMDDNSTDDSLDIIQKYKNNPKVRILLNEVNSGSPFKQWNKGITEAKGEFIWIAESDDYADKTFLETLVQKLIINDNLGLVYCRSWRIDDNDNIIELLEPWANEEHKDRWNNDFINSGVDEIKSYPMTGSNIHNTSAVVFRKTLFEKIDKKFITFRYSGDWFFFVSAMLSTDIGFCAQNLNYYRWHSASVTTGSEKAGLGLLEGYQILNYIESNVKLGLKKHRKLCNHWANYWGLTIAKYSFKMNRLIFRQAVNFDRCIVFRLAFFVLWNGVQRMVLNLSKYIINNFPKSALRFIKYMLGRLIIKVHIYNGKIPWTPTYNEYQKFVVTQSITDSSLLEKFKNNELLPINYGVGVDERCVEYPWLFANLPEDSKFILDAGSVLNYEYILDQPLFKNRDLTIMTLSPEYNCFWYKGISYIYSDLRDIPIRDGYYDVIICISVLEHIGLNNTIFTKDARYNENNLTDFVIAMKELRRILKPHGTLLLSVPYGIYSHLGMQQQFDRKLLTKAIDAFGRTGRVMETFYLYSADGWQQSTDKECAGCHYVEWISRVWEKNAPIPKPVPKEYDLAAAARAVACVLLVKD